MNGLDVMMDVLHSHCSQVLALLKANYGIEYHPANIPDKYLEN
ncbi:MAG TPA: hypothetical protein VEW65_13195 [Chryseolinea sp.]|nr:hypothetical protein [Chryseolinea sp.]